MARFARVVVPGLPYHLTHRGNRRGDVFFGEEDREVYLSMLAESVTRFGVELWAFCLMSNHIHLIGVARHKLAFAYGIGKAHMRYLRWINARRGGRGTCGPTAFIPALLTRIICGLPRATSSRTPCGRKWSRAARITPGRAAAFTGGFASGGSAGGLQSFPRAGGELA